MSDYALYYIETCRESIRQLSTEYARLVLRQKREPNPTRKAQLERELSMIRSEITANQDDIRIAKENDRRREMPIETAYSK
ncbi:MAG: hypothetical protein AAGU15_08860 [Anaerolineaceae bacterium]